MAKITISRPNQADEIRDLTAEEETQRQTDISAETARLEADAEAKIAADEKLASGKAKLKELGLDDDEITQIIGI